MWIDAFGAIPDAELLRSWIRAFGRFEGYRRMFAGAGLGEDPEAALAMFSSPLGEYVDVLDSLDVESVVTWVHVDNIDETLLPLVDRLRRKVVAHRIRLAPSYSTAIEDRAAAAIAHEGLGIAGVCLLPIVDGWPADDPRNDDLFRACERLSLPVWIHSVNTWAWEYPSDFSHPRHADRVAVRFPNLRIVLGHGGWPWVTEAVAIAWRHPNVYVEPSAFRWKRLGYPGSGWEPLLYYGASTIRKKVLFGSIWPLLGQPLAQVLEEFESLPLEAEAQRCWGYENAKRLYRL